MTLKHFLLHPLTKLSFWPHRWFSALNAKGGHVSKNCKKNNFWNHCKRNGHIISECTHKPPQKPWNYQPGHPAKAYTRKSVSNNSPGSDNWCSCFHFSTRVLLLNRLETWSRVQFRVSSITLWPMLSPTWVSLVGPSIQLFLLYLCLISLHCSLIPGRLTIWPPLTNSLQASNHIMDVSKSRLLMVIISLSPSIGLTIPQNHSLTLSNAFFVPKLSANLLSVGQLVDQGCFITFSSSGCTIQDQQTGKVIGTRHKQGRLFLLDNRPRSLLASSFPKTNNAWALWHQRLGHLNNEHLSLLFQNGCLQSFIFNKSIFSASLQSKCHSCCLSQGHILPFPTQFTGLGPFWYCSLRCLANCSYIKSVQF